MTLLYPKGTYSADAPALRQHRFLGQLDRESVGYISLKHYIQWVQRSLNRLLGASLICDGKTSKPYFDAVREFQWSRGLTSTGVVDQKTQNALIKANEIDPVYVLWVQEELNVAGAGALVENGVKTYKTKLAIKTFQAYQSPDIKDDGFVGAKTELKLIKVRGRLPPGHIRPKRRRVNRKRDTDKDLAKKILRAQRYMGSTTIREKRIQCLLRRVTAAIVDGDPLDDCYVDTSPPYGKVRCRKRFKEELKRRHLRKGTKGFIKGVNQLYDEVKHPLERTRESLRKIAADTTSVAILNTPECSFVRLFKKKARTKSSIYYCFRGWIFGTFEELCDVP